MTERRLEHGKRLTDSESTPPVRARPDLTGILARAYGETAAEPIPSDMLALLRRLER